MDNNNMNNVYEQLKQEYKNELEESSTKYSTAKRLKYVLLSKSRWSSLTVDNVQDLITYTGESAYKVSAHDFMYGDKFLTK
jgi:hypothetical protein